MELFAVFGTLFVVLSGLAWYYVGAVIAYILFASAFSDDDVVGAETFLFVGILGGIIWGVWGQVSIIDGILGAVYYLVIGSAWSIFNYARVIKSSMKEDKEKGFKNNLNYYQSLIPKHRIARWVLYFPFSILNFVVGDFIIGIIKRIVNGFGKTYQRITNHYFQKYFG